MAATNANESKIKTDYRFELKSNTDYQTKDNYKVRENQTYRDNFKPKDSYNTKHTYKSSESNFRPENNSKNKETVSYVGKQGEGRNKNSGWKNKEFQRSVFIDKDEDTDGKGSRNFRTGDTRTKSSQNKEKEQQPDKFETIKRLEREKKAMQKKYKDEEPKKPKRPVMKEKRSSKNEWTKSYQFGLLDEEDDYFSF
ncbi:hypothetical protein I5677_12380 [Mobilitalea sibirica]|uniref:Uncharacterized protein n=1 Tax=Mobilitalea sibirica TaxID=1462919 RepID=A0A8J7HB28_9FIRM|nr:hypothetical protein [Mobilitalea sibirica]MBH1941690.1 hypothetical protein [Mobilitalea sibirica]